MRKLYTFCRTVSVKGVGFSPVAVLSERSASRDSDAAEMSDMRHKLRQIPRNPWFADLQADPESLCLRWGFSSRSTASQLTQLEDGGSPLSCNAKSNDETLRPCGRDMRP